MVEATEYWCSGDFGVIDVLTLESIPIYDWYYGDVVNKEVVTNSANQGRFAQSMPRRG